MLSIILPTDIEYRLRSLSINTGRTVQYYAREAILEYMDEMEERFLALNRCGDEIAEVDADYADENGTLKCEMEVDEIGRGGRI